MGFLRRDEVVDMVERRHGYFPKVFFWGGRRYDVYGVEQCGGNGRRGLAGKGAHRCFRVRARGHLDNGTADEAFVIYQDLQDGSWRIERRLG